MALVAPMALGFVYRWRGRRCTRAPERPDVQSGTRCPAPGAGPGRGGVSEGRDSACRGLVVRAAGLARRVSVGEGSVHCPEGRPGNSHSERSPPYCAS